MVIMLISVSTGVYSIDLIQPDSRIVQPGQSLTITCQGSGLSVTNYGRGWVRQREGNPLEWINLIWTGGGINKNDALKNKFSISRDYSGQTVTLTGQNLQPEDTAVYYCARHRTVIQTTERPAQILSKQRHTTTHNKFIPSSDGTNITLCVVKEFVPKKHDLKWLKNGKDITSEIDLPFKVLTSVSESRKDGKKVYTAESFLAVNSSDVNADTEFTCVLTGEQNASLNKPDRDNPVAGEPYVKSYIIYFSSLFQLLCIDIKVLVVYFKSNPNI
uniref:Ig-like domain-containing protein n=1 Tax=Oreochromis niloticus TaxID=8128 RepID=A0A669F1V8_ORENI